MEGQVFSSCAQMRMSLGVLESWRQRVWALGGDVLHEPGWWRSEQQGRNGGRGIRRSNPWEHNAGLVREGGGGVRKEQGTTRGVRRGLVTRQVTATRGKERAGKGCRFGWKRPSSLPLPHSLRPSLGPTFIRSWRVRACDMLMLGEVTQEVSPVGS